MKTRSFNCRAIIDGKEYWRQDGCMGAYWGNGDHKDSEPWIDRDERPFPKRHRGSWSPLALTALQENITIHIHDSDTEEEFMKIKPNWTTRAKLVLIGDWRFISKR